MIRYQKDPLLLLLLCAEKVLCTSYHLSTVLCVDVDDDVEHAILIDLPHHDVLPTQNWVLRMALTMVVGKTDAV